MKYNINNSNDVIALRKLYPKHWIRIIKKHNSNIYDTAVNYNNIYNLNYTSNSQMFYNWCFGIDKQPICSITKKNLKFNNIAWKYRTYGDRGIVTKDMTAKRILSRSKSKSTYSISKIIANITSSNKYIRLNQNVITERLQKYKIIKNGGGILSTMAVNDKELLYNCIIHQQDKRILKLTEAIYCLMNNISPNICPITGNITRFKNVVDGYDEYYTDCKDYKLIQQKKNISIHKRIVENSKQYNISDKNLLQIIKYIVTNEYDKMFQNPQQYINSNYIGLELRIISRTNYLNTDCKFTERLYHIYNDIYSIPQNKFNNDAKFETFISGYRLCENAYTCSNTELEIVNFINSIYTGEVIRNNRKILSGGRELDIYIPEFNLAIELNGEYYHSDTFKPKQYHLNKLEECNKLNITLIHIWALEWETRSDIVKSMIKSRLNCNIKLYARQCVIGSITKDEKSKFLIANHLQGNDNSQTYVGAYYNNELVSVMTFGMRQLGKVKKFELIRFCSKLGYTIVGGASRLFKYYTSNNNITNITTYADRRWSNGKVYNILGFTLSHISAINYWYYKNKKIYHRVSFQKHKLKNKLLLFDNNKTESKNMIDNGYYRIWDCGNYVFSWTK